MSLLTPCSYRFAGATLLALQLAMAPTAQVAADAAVQVNAVAATSPPSLTFSWPASATATGWSVTRRPAGSSSWSTAMSIPGGAATTSWVDDTVVVGTRYEYRFFRLGSPTGRGFVTAGVEADAIEDRGTMILVVDDTHAQALAPSIDRLIQDLVGDGWQVLRHDVSPTQSVTSVKALIVADYRADPSGVRAVFLFGHVPVPYSGRIAPDGHSNHRGAWPADGYYGDVDGTWTDTSVNETSASRSANHNVPGDGKFDQGAIPSNLELAVGRVDLANMPAFAASEQQLLQNYLDKDHDYRHKRFTVAQRAVIDDNFRWFNGEAFAASGWRAFSALVGTSNITAGDYFTTQNTASGPGYVWSYGCGGGSYTRANGVGNTSDFAASTNRNVFTMLFGSYFGDWDSTNNFLRAPLCSGWTLSNAWAGRPHWSFHPMGMGETLGFCARLSQNDTAVGGFGLRGVHMGLMGDPSLRQHVVAPAGGLSLGPDPRIPSLSWTASADPVDGYRVYRSASPAGPFVRLAALSASTLSYTDPSPRIGPATYMVRAERLEVTPTGSYHNLSQGLFVTTCTPNLPAEHLSYGRGCHAASDSFYEVFETAADARAALQGRAIVLTPASTNAGYDVAVTARGVGSGYVAPSAAAVVLPLGDDDRAVITPSTPLPYPGGGTAASLEVDSNGVVTTLPASPLGPDPNVPDFLNRAGTAWHAWRDFDPSEAGSGSVKWEESGGVLYVTWDGVESPPAAVTNPSTLQFQFDLSTGVVRVVCDDLSAVGLAGQGPRSERSLFGFSPSGRSADAGPTGLATTPPFSVGRQNIAAITLDASPAPVSTASSGTAVDYSIRNVPVDTGGGAARSGALLFSSTAVQNGTPLALIGMPECALYIGPPDFSIPFSGSSGSMVVPLSIPPGVPCGVTLYATAAAFIVPGSDPRGVNLLGVVTSNGLMTRVGAF